jgi:axial budding pattern protein 2
VSVLVLATPSVSVPIPLNGQLPPIARVDKPYSWTFAGGTFLSARNASLVYSALALPTWLSFDSATRTFSGTPVLDDEGAPRIKVLATDPETSDSASSSLSLCVTPHAPSVVLSKPLSLQFKSQDNPSLGSVFVLSDGISALQRTQNPTLRIPPGWSFSIGFDGDTFTGMGDALYAVLQADGSPLPSWVTFNPDEITLNGVTPPLDGFRDPYLSLALHLSDHSGFSVASELFDVVIATHELHASMRGLPTINTTSSTTLDVLLNSQIYFDGILVDDAPLDIQNLISLVIDVSQYSWLHYDADSRRLSGQLPGDFSTRNDTVLPVTLNTVYNQTLRTQVKLASVPSYFSQDPLPQISAVLGKDLHFNLMPFFSNATLGNVDLTASYEPADASSYLHFDTASAVLSGSIPSPGKLDYALITVSFYAYSSLTHSMSHTSLPISVTPTDHEHTQPTTGSLFRGPRRRLALGLAIALALLGGLLVLGLLLAALRCFARPPDPALTGEAATRAMTESDRQWYGIGDREENTSNNAEKGYSTHTNGRFGELGIGLPRAMTFSSSNDERSLASPGQVSKAEFLGRLRATVRKVSNRYRGARKSAISRPVLVVEAGDSRVLGTPAIPALSGYEPMGYSGTGTTTSSLRGSPSSSTGERSIPQRRADFAPPRVPAPAPVAIHVPSRSLDSDISLASNSSTRTHAAEAVVQRAARARSVYGAGGGQQLQANHDGPHVGRARVVPFTAGRTPAPREGPIGTKTGVPPARASSLSASVVRVVIPPSQQQQQQFGAVGASEADELHVGLRYVRALGEDAREGSESFSSLESSSRPARSSLGSGGAGAEVLRVLVRVGERFRFRLPVRIGAGATGAGGGLTARRVTGELLPAFMYADLEAGRGDNQKHRDTVKFWGVPRADDIGNVHVGVYTANGVCVGEAVIEVLVRSG